MRAVAVAVAATVIAVAPAAPATALDRPVPASTSQSDDTRLTFERLEASDGVLTTPQGRVEDLELSAQDVVVASSTMTMGTATVDGVVPFRVVAEQIGPGATVTAIGDGEARVTRSVEVLGRRLGISATGRVDVGAGAIVVEPVSVETGGPEWLEGLLARTAGRFVALRHDVQGLPEGLELERASVVDEGIRVHLTGEDVVLRQ